jgi:hypothetical protein
MSLIKKYQTGTTIVVPSTVNKFAQINKDKITLDNLSSNAVVKNTKEIKKFFPLYQEQDGKYYKGGVNLTPTEFASANVRAGKLAYDSEIPKEEYEKYKNTSNIMNPYRTKEFLSTLVQPTTDTVLSNRVIKNKKGGSIIKKYQTGDTLQNSYSFDNNQERKSQKLKPKSLKKNSDGSNYFEQADLYESNAKSANELLKPKDLDYSKISEENIANQQAADAQAAKLSAGTTAALNTASSVGKMAKAGSSAAKIGTSAGKAIPLVGAMIALSETAGQAKAAIKKNDYGEGESKMGDTGKNALNMLSPSQGVIDEYKLGKAEGDKGKRVAGVIASNLLGLEQIRSGAKMVTSLAGKNDETSGVWGAINKVTGVTKNRKRIDAQKGKIKSDTDKENAILAEERRINTGRAADLAKYNRILGSTSTSGQVFKKGGVLIPKFRRGGALDEAKENVILDGPSHDDHNNTGVKNDKGLPVVKKGVKIAEIESLELVLNKTASDKIKKLKAEYDKTGEESILKEIGDLMKKELKDNTYDYSKKLL